jgi:hypothetical protein
LVLLVLCFVCESESLAPLAAAAAAAAAGKPATDGGSFIELFELVAAYPTYISLDRAFQRNLKLDRNRFFVFFFFFSSSSSSSFFHTSLDRKTSKHKEIMANSPHGMVDTALPIHHSSCKPSLPEEDGSYMLN